MSTGNFTNEELQCRCGCGLLPPQEFQETLQAFRAVWGHPMRISSGARCPAHNERVSTTGRNGPHTLGAVDVLIHGEAAWDFLRAALEFGWRGVGVSQRGAPGQRFIHLDDLEDGAHPRPRCWSY